MRSLAPILLLLTAAWVLPAGAQTPTDSTKDDTTHVETTMGYGAWFGSVPEMESNSIGVTLVRATPDSPADKAGLKKGDVITAMAGRTVLDLQDMVTVLRRHRAGETIDVTFWRGEVEKHVKVTLGTRPAR